MAGGVPESLPFYTHVRSQASYTPAWPARTHVFGGVRSFQGDLIKRERKHKETKLLLRILMQYCHPTVADALL